MVEVPHATLLILHLENKLKWREHGVGKHVLARTSGVGEGRRCGVTQDGRYQNSWYFLAFLIACAMDGSEQCDGMRPGAYFIRRMNKIWEGGRGGIPSSELDSSYPPAGRGGRLGGADMPAWARCTAPREVSEKQAIGFTCEGDPNCSLCCHCPGLGQR